MPRNRSSAFEWLRIFAMATIVLGHACGYSGIDRGTMVSDVNRMLIDCFSVASIGVSLFVMLTGYFGADSQFRVRKVLRMQLQVYFYLFLGLAVKAAFGSVSLIEMRNALLPILTGQYWFYSTYIVFYLITPFLSVMFRALSRRQYAAWICVAGVLWSIIPSFSLTKFSMSANALVEFVYYYSLGMFVRLHITTDERTVRRAKTAIVVSAAVTALSIVIPYCLGLTQDVSTNKRFFFLARYSPNLLVICVSLLCIAKHSEGRVRDRRGVNAVAAATFGVYLFHDNRVLRYFIWNQFAFPTLAESPLMLPAIAAGAALVFCVGTLVELLRRNTVERITMPVVNRLCDACSARFSEKMSLRRNER